MADMDRDKNPSGTGQKPGQGEQQPQRPGQGEQQPQRPGQPQQQPGGPDRGKRDDEESGQPVQLDKERRQEGPPTK